LGIEHREDMADLNEEAIKSLKRQLK
jgi:hypothetical protein